MSSLTAEFGYTLWGRDFLRLVEPTSVTRPEPLLPRARSLARNALTDVQIDGRLIRGTVVRGGDASVAYVEFSAIDRDTAQTVAAAVGPTPGVAALTDRVHALVARTPPELAVVDCSCRARTARCVHVLALLYECVRSVDEDPTLALRLRGFRDAVDGADVPDEGVERWTPLSALDPQTFFER
ncbi:hypothetical protein [Gordonia hydrophobica]|uniref:SWIM-type domain-containing protein n=1 Tax=Gordonia hydrophobica TaxID=40516 RepID=A0ABZ2TYX0_9ACTN|nr:hypothetical protein [Gordonia hydrophobica]MBM7367221.1 putative Zn finger protein [Gordonia hydrophobica]